MVIVFAPTFARIQSANSYLVALFFFVVLYFSVFLHELAHLIVARVYGMRVRSLTLHLMGGETLIEGESRTPGQEIVTAIVGPAVSLLIGVFGLVTAPLATSELGFTLLWTSGFVNIVVGLFNLLPGLPMDGGRVMRGIIWGISGSESAGTIGTGWTGRLTAVLGAAWAVLTSRVDQTSGLLRTAIVLLLAGFLWHGASNAIHHGRRMRRIERLTVHDLYVPEHATPSGVSLQAELSGRALIIAMTQNPAQVYDVVAQDGTVIGRLYSADVDRAYREEKK